MRSLSIIAETKPGPVYADDPVFLSHILIPHITHIMEPASRRAMNKYKSWFIISTGDGIMYMTTVNNCIGYDQRYVLSFKYPFCFFIIPPGFGYNTTGKKKIDKKSKSEEKDKPDKYSP